MTTTKNMDVRSLVAGMVGVFAAAVGIGMVVVSGSAGADEAAEFYGGEYSMDEVVTAAEMEASFYGDDNPGLNYQYADEVGVMDQDDFPCTEDEVLGYSPEFGPGMVGCIHIDSIV